MLAKTRHSKCQRPLLERSTEACHSQLASLGGAQVGHRASSQQGDRTGRRRNVADEWAVLVVSPRYSFPFYLSSSSFRYVVPGTLQRQLYVVGGHHRRRRPPRNCQLCHSHDHQVTRRMRSVAAIAGTAAGGTWQDAPRNGHLRNATSGPARTVARPFPVFFLDFSFRHRPLRTHW